MLSAMGSATATNENSKLYYQESNQGVTISKRPSVASEARTKVQMEGARHIHMILNTSNAASVTRSMLSQILRLVKIAKILGMGWLCCHSTSERITEF